MFSSLQNSWHILSIALMLAFLWSWMLHLVIDWHLFRTGSFHLYITFEALGLVSLVPEYTSMYHQLITLAWARSLLSVAPNNAQ